MIPIWLTTLLIFIFLIILFIQYGHYWAGWLTVGIVILAVVVYLAIERPKQIPYLSTILWFALGVGVLTLLAALSIRQIRDGKDRMVNHMLIVQPLLLLCLSLLITWVIYYVMGPEPEQILSVSS